MKHSSILLSLSCITIIISFGVCFASSSQNIYQGLSAAERLWWSSHPARADWELLTSTQLHHSTQHAILIALKPANRSLLEETFWSISTPSSANYAQYLTHEQLARIVAPSTQDMHRLNEWFSENSIEEVNFVATKDVARVVLSIGQINKLFNVEMKQFRHKNGRVIIRSLRKLQIPSTLKHIIHHIKGVNDLPIMKRKRSMSHDEELEVYGKQATERLNTIAAVGGSTAPIVLAAKSRGATSVTFTPVCNNMQPAHTLPPCADNQPSIVEFDVVATAAIDTISNETYTKAFLLSEVSCNIASDSNNVVCEATIAANRDWVPLYYPYSVGVQTVFENGYYSDVGYNIFPVVRVPPVTPATLANLYSIPPNTLITNPNTTQSVVEFEQQYYSPDDLKNFLDQNGLPDDTPVSIIGPNYANNSGVEANLDIQYIMGLAPGAPTVFWSILANSSVEIDDILSWAYAIGNATNPPLVSSLSYGMSANQVDKFLGDGYLDRSDVEFQKLAILGLTVIIASGDTGAGDLGPPPMSNPICDTLHPDWPSQSPYVTSVGSTVASPLAEPICYLPSSQGGIDCGENPVREILASLEQGVLFTGGGGFADYPTRPSYQDHFVLSYLQKAKDAGLLPPNGIWNSSGRAYPDFSTIGHNCMVSQNGNFIAVDGTSASAPIFGGIISLLNDARLNAGMPPLGFINPLFYQIALDTPQAFYDVTVGSNRCGAYGQSPLCCDAAFHALPGFDAVSGLGSPNFSVLKDRVLLAGIATTQN